MDRHEQIFQDRVDELLVLEKRAAQRTQELVKCSEGLKKQVCESIDKVSDVFNHVDSASKAFEYKVEHKLARLQEINMLALKGAKELARLGKYSMIATAAVITIIGAIFGWSIIKLRYINSEIIVAETKLAALDRKLSFTPVIVERDGKHYVKIVSSSYRMLLEERETTFKKAKFGYYAEMWQIKR